MTLFDVLVVGGNGRVGSSTVRWLDLLARRTGKRKRPLLLAIGGRSASNFQVSRCQGLKELAFVPVDLDSGIEALVAAVRKARLVVHTAGPFQGRSEPDLLQACITAGVPYCDVCDELLLSRNAKALSAKATMAGVPAVVSCGIWPGVSALMASAAVEKLGGPGACDRIELNFYTAGTGGAGATIVTATLLLLSTEVVTYEEGELTYKEPWTDRRMVDFGRGIGEHECFLLDNPDVPTIAEALRVTNCSSRFGTAPGVWNKLFGAMKHLPRDLLKSREVMHSLTLFSMPIIRAVDSLVGATNAIHIDAYSKCGGTVEKVTLRCVHSDLEDCVGQATAAFCMELLRGREAAKSEAATIDPGVWFPVELEARARNNILNVAKEKALIWQI